MNMAILKGDFLEQYVQKVKELGDEGLYQILDERRKLERIFPIPF